MKATLTGLASPVSARGGELRLELRSNSPAAIAKEIGDPNGIRTRVTAVKGRCPNRWTIGSKETVSMAISARIARADPPKERSGQGGRMRGRFAVDDLKRHRHGMRADHAVTIHL